MKYGRDDKKWETCGIKCKDCECCLEYTSVKDNLIEYKCLCWNKNYQKNFDENLKKRFANAYIFLTMKSISLFCCSEKCLPISLHGWLPLPLNETPLPLL